MGSFWDKVKAVQAQAPVADAYDGDPAGDVVSMKNYNRCAILVQEGVGTTGTATLTVEACDDFTPSNTTAVVFRYKVVTSGDTEGAWTAATTSGFTTTAGSNHLYLLEVDSAALPDGEPNVRVQITEVANAAVLAGVMYFLHEPRYAEDQMATTIA